MAESEHKKVINVGEGYSITIVLDQKNGWVRVTAGHANDRWFVTVQRTDSAPDWWLLVHAKQAVQKALELISNRKRHIAHFSEVVLEAEALCEVFREGL